MINCKSAQYETREIRTESLIAYLSIHPLFRSASGGTLMWAGIECRPIEVIPQPFLRRTLMSISLSGLDLP